jgi:AcrR family transcriptional regulator
MTGKTIRAERVDATRESILVAAERLFAEQGLFAISNRQVSEAAGQGNNAAVGYHFGTKADLVRAIVRKHAAPIERTRTRMVEEIDDAATLRDWVACLVQPMAEHLSALGTPSWFARFSAQAMTDPTFRQIMQEESLSAPSLHQVVDGINRCLPELPAEVRAERDAMFRLLMVHTWAEREREVADGQHTPRSTWQETATGMTDAIVGLYQAPVTPVS